MCDFEKCPMLKEHADAIKRNEASIAKLSEDLAPAIEVWAALAGVARILKWTGIAIKWIGGVFAAIFGMWKMWEYFAK